MRLPLEGEHFFTSDPIRKRFPNRTWRRYGTDRLVHLSHQNGLDVDIYYRRADGRADRPQSPSLVDRRLAQDLVDRFVAAGAEKVFVGPRLALEGPRRIVVPLAHRDDHLHLRLPPAGP